MSFLRRPVVLVVLGIALLGLAGLALASRDTTRVDKAAATRCVFPPCRAAQNPTPARGYEGAYVLADPKDGEHVVIADTDLVAAKCGWHTTFNRGKDWIDGFFAIPTEFTGCRINGASGGHVPSGNLGVGPSGAIYSVFGSADAADGARESVLVAKSTDGGKTFGPATVAVRPPDPTVGLARPLLDVVRGPSGKDSVLLSFWSCHRVPAGTACDAALFSRSDDGGDTFSSPVLVNDPPNASNPSQPAVGPDGAVYETFERRFTDTVDILLAKSTDGGKTFAVSKVDSQIQVGVQYDAVKLLIDPRSGVLFAAWSDNRTGRQQIFVRRSKDGGATWEEKAAILSPDSQNTGTSRSPWISLSPDGRVDVVYYHTAPQPERQKTDDVYWSYSADGGDTYTVGRLVNDRPIDRTKGYSGPVGSLGLVGNHYPPTVSSTDAAAFVVWSDTSNADPVANAQDVMLRRMDVTGGAPPP